MKNLTTRSITLAICSILIVSVLSSCVMNSRFVKPLEFPANIKKITINVGSADSTKVYFDSLTKNPTFVKQGETLYNNVRFESVWFTNKRGNKLNGWIMTSKTAAPIPYNIVCLRGAGHETLMATQFQSMEPLLHKGFKILIFDYEGFGFSEGKADRYKIVDDGIAAVDYMRSFTDKNTTKLLIYGQSFGGSLATEVAVRTESKIDGLISEGAFSSHKDMSNHYAGLKGKIFVREIYAAKNSVKEFHKPILIIHSNEDETTPFAMGQKIYKNANQPKVFFEIKGKHLEGPALYGEEIKEKIIQLFK
jgi:uncharacterized protein